MYLYVVNLQYWINCGRKSVCTPQESRAIMGSVKYSSIIHFSALMKLSRIPQF